MLRLGRGLRLSLLLSTLVAAAVAPQATFLKEAKADTAGKKKVAVGAFEGVKAGDARSAFIDSLKQDGGYEVTDAEDVKHSAKDKAIKDAAKGLGVNVVITGKLQKTTLKLKVRDGATGKVLDEVEIKGASQPKLKANIEKTGAASVAAAIGETKAAEPEPKPEEKPAEEEEEKPAEEEEEKPAEDNAGGEPGPDDGLTPLEITAGLRAVHRTFDFHQTAADVRPNGGFEQLLRYELPLGPALFIDVNVYPASFITKGAAEWFGLTGGFEKGFATQSVFLENQPNERTLKTDMQHFYVGPRFRFPIGEHQLSALGTFGQHKFVLTGDEDLLLPLIPDITYTYIRAGLDGSFRFGDFLVGARAGKRFVLGTGEIEKVWFKQAKATSLEAGVTVGYRLVSILDLVAGFDWVRYAFDFNPVEARLPTQRSYVAGGAVDQYFTGHIAFQFHLPHSDSAQ